ncbi:SEC10/PgrA surface exclusion domain-containing protein [Streptococcus suis]|uniref:SEC10/PgrA surface exclusion domain-containing protein n=1 Tax=Streptococcus suis TaxID=1307 RepID=UPI002410A349|nr:SEC10/PgrA surface exclusion domain-containing protein [Streptococcus suis]MDG3136260.1 SEC10/PgrA surface exclusion domain-containing protein [Streptococcus suis]
MKKVTVLGALATSVMISGRQVVQAEEVQPQATEPATEATTATEATVTETDVIAAKADLDAASQAVATQEATVQEAEAGVKTAQTEAEQAHVNLVDTTALVEQASPENIVKAKEAITEAEAKVSDASQSLEAKNQEALKAEEAVKAQEATVSTAQAEVNTKAEAVTEALKAVDTAQAILDGTGQAEVIAQAEKAEKQLTEGKQAVATAQTELVVAQEADAKRQTAITEATQVLSQAETRLDDKKRLASQATDKAEETAKQLATAQSAFQKAENDKNGINTITLSAEYVAALKEYQETYSQSAKEKLDRLVPALRSQQQFKANLNDDTQLLDTNNLSEAVRTELSLFASDLINQVRQMAGTTQTVVTQSALDFADRVTDGYVADNWSFKQVVTVGHDVPVINEVARQLGLRTSTEEEAAQGLQYYEDMNTVGQKEPSVTLSSAKRAIYQSLVAFLYNGREYFHTLSILGLSSNSSYVGVDLSSRQDAFSVHILSVPDTMIQTGSRFDRKAIENPQTSQAILATYQETQNALSQATRVNNLAQEEKKKALSNQAELEHQVTTARAQLTTAQAMPILTPQAQAKLVTAQEAVKKAEAAYEEAQTNLAHLQADVKVKQANLAQAKQVLAEKQATLTQVRKVLVSEQAMLDHLKEELQASQKQVTESQAILKNAQTGLAEAETHLVQLQQAPELLKQAKARLAMAQADVKAKEAVLTEALDKLKTLKEEKVTASEHYQTVLSAYQALLEAQRQAELAKQYEAILREGGQAVPIVDETGRITGYRSQSIKPVKLPSPADKPMAGVTQTKQATGKTLPSTGEAQSLLTLIGSVLLGGTTWFSRRKK